MLINILNGVKRPQLVPKLRLTLATNDEYVERTIEAIVRGARTGDVGDGIIFVTPIETCVRIRTGDRGNLKGYGSSVNTTP
jgi:nitrogen regulatory protein PII